MKRALERWAAPWAVCGAALMASACGGGDASDDITATLATNRFAEESEYGPGDRPGPLAATDLRPAALPADLAARTRPGLYVRREAAERWEREHPGEGVWLDAGCCANEGPDLALYLAFGMQAAQNLDDDAPFLVAGADQRLAATLVNALADKGIRRAYLVMP
jgi:hypothetical protein